MKHPSTPLKIADTPLRCARLSFCIFFLHLFQCLFFSCRLRALRRRKKAVVAPDQRTRPTWNTPVCDYSSHILTIQTCRSAVVEAPRHRRRRVDRWITDPARHYRPQLCSFLTLTVFSQLSPAYCLYCSGAWVCGLASSVALTLQGDYAG